MTIRVCDVCGERIPEEEPMRRVSTNAPGGSETWDLCVRHFVAAYEAMKTIWELNP